MVLDSDSPKEQTVRVVVRVRPMNEKENKANTLPVVTGSTEKREASIALRLSLGRRNRAAPTKTSAVAPITTPLGPSRPAAAGRRRPATATAASLLPQVTLIRGVGQRQIRQVYHFDSVYASYSTQCEVFETVRPLVHEVMQGFEATVFAYGQTGTGKTHTMEGEIVCEEKKGIIPRAVEAIFESLGEKGKYASSAVTASYLEIYNEELSDLLTEARCGEMWGDTTCSHRGERPLEIAREHTTSLETVVLSDHA